MEVGWGKSFLYITLNRSVHHLFILKGINCIYFGLNSPVIDMFWCEIISSVILSFVEL